MSLSTYATARTDLAAAITAVVPAKWSVYDHPPDAIDDWTIAVSVRPSTQSGPARWIRELVIGVFVRRDSIAEGLDALDSVIPTIAGIDLDGATFGDPSEPRAASLAESDYLAVLFPVHIETTS